MKAILVGGGPVGCLLAIGLRRRGFDVVIYEKCGEPRHDRPKRDHSFNLTLSLRGLEALSPELRQQLYRDGVRLCQRVIHHLDGTVSAQPYGTSDEHHLLSIPRRVLHGSLREAAASAGAELRFGHECIRADPARPAATFAEGSVIHEVCGDLLVGCDGANSTIRQELVQRGSISAAVERSDYGYVELELPALTGPEGFHIWPRGDFMLIAQPNADGTHTTTLFLPIAAFARLREQDAVERFFRQQFPDLAGAGALLARQFHLGPPSALKSVRCFPFHDGRTVLIGDAAHAMLPFYGQGINCSFEDVRVLLELIDSTEAPLSAFTAARSRPCAVIAELSEKNLHELARETTDRRFRARASIERELHRRDPQAFVPLYCMMAFSTIPYDQGAAMCLRQRRRLDALCRRFDVETEGERIIEAYLLAEREPFAGSRLQLTVQQARDLLDLARDHVLAHEADLAAGKFPASYVADSVHVAAYEQGRLVSAALREDEPPRQGAEPGALLGEIFDRAIACGTVHPHPGFMAHIPSGGLLQGAVGDFIARAVNRFAGVWIAAPGLIRIESNVIRWFCTLLGYGPESFGYLTTSGSIANMMGLVCARGGDVVYASEQAHFSILKAARLLGIAHVRTIPVTSGYAMNVAELGKAIAADRAAGLRPRCVVATAGTTNTGAIDDLRAIGSLCRAQEIPLHVDACFGGFYRMTARGRMALEGIEEAASIAIDAHKSLFLPHGSSALLVRQRNTLREAFEVPDAAYLPGFSSDPELIDFCNHGPELSREIRGLTAWLPLKLHGIPAFERALDETLDLAHELAEELDRIDPVAVVRRHPIHLPVVPFRLRDGDDAQTQRLCNMICSYGRVYVTTTTLPGEGLVIRACILNHRTDRETVHRLVEDVEIALEECGRERKRP